MEYIGRLHSGASRLRWHRSRAFPDLRAPRGGRGGPDVGYTHPRPLVLRHPVNPPGPEGSKGKRALAGARGVLAVEASGIRPSARPGGDEGAPGRLGTATTTSQCAPEDTAPRAERSMAQETSAG